MPAKKKVSLGGLQQRRPADAQDAAQGYQAGDDIVFDDDQNLDQVCDSSHVSCWCCCYRSLILRVVDPPPGPEISPRLTNKGC